VPAGGWRVGEVAEFSRTLGDAEVRAFAELSGDFNPVHLDEEAGRQSSFGGRIVHGALVVSLISSTLAMRLPGAGTIYLRQAVRFTRPVRLGDTVTARVEIVELMDKGRLRLATTCRNQHGELVVDGEAQVIPPARA
jgi:3-hydroxybutyryl-CoA dehydratase